MCLTFEAHSILLQVHALARAWIA